MRVPYLTQKLILGGGKVECDPMNKSRGLDRSESFCETRMVFPTILGSDGLRRTTIHE